MINLPKNLKNEIQQTKVNRLIEADKTYNEKVTESLQSVQTTENENKTPEPEFESTHQQPPLEDVITVVSPVEIETEPETIPEIEKAAEKAEIVSEAIAHDNAVEDNKPITPPNKEKKTRPTKTTSTIALALNNELDPKKTILEQRSGEEWFQWFNQAPFEDVVQEFIKQYPKKNETIKYEKEQRNILLSDELFLRIKQQLKKIDQMCEDVHESNAEDAKAHSNRGWIGWYIENVIRAHFQMEPMRRGKN